MPQIKGKNVLITGGAGFIGSHLTDALLKNQAGKVVIVDNFFLGKMENLDFAQKNYNNLSHLSAMMPYLGRFESDYQKGIRRSGLNLATIR